MKSYDPGKIDNKWQKEWKKKRIHEALDSATTLKKTKPNFYMLVEFPYPSGDLHVGHWYAFAVPDIFVRMKRMQGYNLLFPIGFDSFGLPAENAAIQNKVDPSKWTWKNIERMRKQLCSMGATFDWSREVVTCDPEYYRWTQWLFLEFYKRGLAYRGNALVNWDPIDKTVLANEQVLPDGTAERSGARVEKKELEQWFVKITDYADRLSFDLESLDWPHSIKEAQKNWIGKSDGAEISFQVSSVSLQKEIKSKNLKLKAESRQLTSVKVFTTRPDTIFGATYLVISPEHKLLENNELGITNYEEVKGYIQKAKLKTEIERTSEGKEKTGVFLKGVSATNPATGNKIPVWVADYVLPLYGTGAIMAVPADDKRDEEFAKKYKLPVIKNYKSAGFIDFGKKTTTYKLRDWLISRQRYWGVPIPIVYDPDGKPHPIPPKHLPWILPTDVDFNPTGVAPLAKSKELLKRTEKIFGKGWKPEIDTMDTFVDSSWYFLRYLDSKNKKEFSSIKKQKLWMPVDRYSGGSEHTNMHLLYSRFFYKALYDLGLVTEKEPYRVRLNRGIILAEDGRKMSKRWKNVVNPDEQVKKVGTDAVRTYLAFIGPYNEVGSYPWSTNGLIGVRRFLERVWKLQEKISENANETKKEIEYLIHKTTKKVTDDVESMKFNTAVSALMILTNELTKEVSVSKENYEILLKLLTPFAPHISEEIWHTLGNKNFITMEKWPEYDKEKTKSENTTFVVQINGKTRATFAAQTSIEEKVALELAKELEEIKKWLAGKKVKKTIFVSGRLINIISD